MDQEIRFCTTPDGVRRPTGSTISSSTGHRLLRYDERGNGLSDWDVDDISFEAFVRDPRTVVDAAGLEQVDARCDLRRMIDGGD